MPDLHKVFAASAASLLSLCILLFWASGLAAQPKPEKFVETKAKAGDGVFRLLGRYNLEQSTCNLDKFHSINKTKPADPIIEGKTYLLPLYIYTYDGKSIRSTIGNSDYPLAKRIETYNDKMKAEGLRVSDYRVSKVLWVPHQEIGCQPTVVKKARPVFKPYTKNYPVFGKLHQKVNIKDDQLGGAVIYVVPGHGGPDPGAIGKRNKHTLCEDEYAYDVSLRFAKGLIEHNATVYIITIDPNDGIRSGEILLCDVDEVGYPNQRLVWNAKARLGQGADAIQALKIAHDKQGDTYQRAVNIHVDSRQKQQRIDVFFYHFPGSEQGKALAKLMYKTMEAKYAITRPDGDYDGTYGDRDLYMLREVTVPSVLLELGNIQNAADQNRIIYESNRQAIAAWLVEAVVKDYQQSK